MKVVQEGGKQFVHTVNAVTVLSQDPDHGGTIIIIHVVCRKKNVICISLSLRKLMVTPLLGFNKGIISVI